MFGAITGVLASRNNRYEYFTSLLYPILIEDTLSVQLPSLQTGNLWLIPVDYATVSVPELLSGTLITTAITYNEPLAREYLTSDVPELLSGNLITTVIIYNEVLAREYLTSDVPELLSGDLEVVIIFITYDEPLAREYVTVGVPELLSGDLL